MLGEWKYWLFSQKDAPCVHELGLRHKPLRSLSGMNKRRPYDEKVGYIMLNNFFLALYKMRPVCKT